MKLEHWHMVTVIGIAEMLLSSLLLRLDAPRLLAQILVLGGTGTFFGSLIGAMIYESRHPALRCPQCGKGGNTRYVRRTGGAVTIFQAGKPSGAPTAGRCSGLGIFIRINESCA